MFIPQTYSPARNCFLYFNDHTLYGSGKNDLGQLGLGHKNYVYEPTFIMTDPDIIKIFCSSEKSLLLKKDGSVWMTDDDSMKFNHLFTDPDIVDVVMIQWYIVILLNNGSVKVYCQNEFHTLYIADVCKIFVVSQPDNIFLYMYTKNNNIYKIPLVMTELSKPKYFKTIKDLTDLFVFENELFIVTLNTIEVHYDDQVFVKYQGSDIRRVIVSNNNLLLRKKDNSIHDYYINATFIVEKIVMMCNKPQLKKELHNIAHSSWFKYKKDINKDDLLYIHDVPLILSENSVDDLCIYTIDKLDVKEKKEASSLMLQITNMLYGKKDCLPLNYDTPIKIFNAGSVVYKFDPDNFFYLPSYLKRGIKFLVLYFKRYSVENGLNIPKFVRYLIYDWLIKLW